MKNFTAKFLSFALLATIALNSQAQVYLDVEPDPVPLFDLTVVIPQGTLSKDSKTSVNFAILQAMLEAGTLQLKREEFLDALAEFGAQLSVSMAGQYSTWSLRFPYQNNKDYSKLVALLQQNWDSPRLNQEEFNRYKVMGLNNMKSSLNADSQLVSGTGRRWILKKALGLSPVFEDTFKLASLKEVKSLYSRFKDQKQLWAGFVGPDSLKPMVKDIISKVFKLTDFREEKYLKVLPTLSPAGIASAPVEKTLLIISKPGRTQNVIALLAISAEKLTPSRELDFLIGDHVAVSGGLGSVYGEALRTKGGFSYSVASTGSTNFAGYPMLGFFSNPMSSKQTAAMDAIEGLINKTFKAGGLFEELSSHDWNTRIASFRYEKVFSQMTPDSRLSERQAVVVGSSSPELYHSDPLNWNATAKDVQAYYKKHWQNSHIVMSVLGDPEELKKVAAKNFPDFKVKVIPYTETISSRSFD